MDCSPVHSKTRRPRKIALPSKGQQIDGRFGHCESSTIFSVDGDRGITSQETLTPPAGCGCKSNIIPQLADMGVKVMLAGNRGDGSVNMLSNYGITVARGCVGDVRQVADARLAQEIQDSGVGRQSHVADG